MYKKITLSLFIASSIMYGSEILLPQMNIQSTIITKVAQNAKTSSNIVDALSKSVPSIDMSRRSGSENDILIRGQKRDNISIDMDGVKMYGAGPNRMDPPISNILASQIQSIEVIEGPYDIENFGTLSGGIKIKTKKPSKKIQGSLHTSFGSFDYRKFGATISGGSDKIRVLLTGNIESSNQYKDANGDTLTQQVQNTAVFSSQYKTKYKDLKAYDKRSLSTKAFANLTKNQELQLSYTANRSSNILYPNAPMDGEYANSDIYSIAYNVKDLSSKYKNANIKYYYSSVEHAMNTKYKNASNMANMDITNSLQSSMQGLKLKNTLMINNHKILIGLDISRRDWSGEYLNTTTQAYKADSISYTQTINKALFIKIDKTYGDFDTSLAMRYDSTEITNAKKLPKKDYSALNLNIISTYHINDNNKLFAGFGKASRVPDARELYFIKAGNMLGTPTLDQTTNNEFDLGYKNNYNDFKLKIKLFYSILKNYIYIKKGSTTNAFYNIDANIFGGEFSGTYYINDEISLDTMASYKRGLKTSPLANQTDKDLADIAPLRGKVSLNYEYKNNSIASIELQASDKWSNIDSDNGEQVLSAWSVINMKVKHSINKKFDFTMGVNNLLNQNYAISNTYADLSIIVSGTSKAILINEPGRYIYTNLDFRF